MHLAYHRRISPIHDWSLIMNMHTHLRFSPPWALTPLSFQMHRIPNTKLLSLLLNQHAGPVAKTNVDYTHRINANMHAGLTSTVVAALSNQVALGRPKSGDGSPCSTAQITLFLLDPVPMSVLTAN